MDWKTQANTNPAITLSELYNNRAKTLFVEISGSENAYTFLQNPTAYAEEWQIVFLPDYKQIWTQGDLYGTNSYEYQDAIEQLRQTDTAIATVINPYGWDPTLTSAVSAIEGNNNSYSVSYIDNYLYSQIKSTQVSVAANNENTSFEGTDVAYAYLDVASQHSDETGTSYTISLYNTASYSYVTSAYAYIENQIKNINSVNDNVTTYTTTSINAGSYTEGEAYLTVSHAANGDLGVSYTISLNNVASYTDMHSYVKSYVGEAITNLIGGAPEALDTLKEIADWIADDPTYSATLVSYVNDLKDAYTYFTNSYIATNTRINDLENAYTYFEDAYTYFEDAYTYIEGQIRDLNTAYTYFENAYTYIEGQIRDLNTAYQYFETGYSYFDTRIHELDKNGYFYVDYGNNGSPTETYHGGTVKIDGTTVYALYTGTNGTQTDTINNAIKYLEDSITSLTGGSVDTITSSNGSITANKSGHSYDITTSAGIIPVSGDSTYNYITTDTTVQAAIGTLDAQAKTNADNIQTNANAIQAIQEALNWTIVTAGSQENP